MEQQEVDGIVGRLYMQCLQLLAENQRLRAGQRGEGVPPVPSPAGTYESSKAAVKDA